MTVNLPSGAVTFLFTDIEGSTKLWERHPRQMKRALARHDALLRSIFESQNGYVFKTVGDAFCVAFTSPVDALRAALEAQRALQNEAWQETPILVRMGLHSGEAEERDGDYFGPSVNRTARLMSAGHGGQVLLSHTTQQLVREQLPPAIELRDMGRHSLKDLAQPEHIFQTVAPLLAADFPPLRTLNIRLNNLPSQVTPFIGRDREVSAVQDLISPNHQATRDVRLLTLTGPGGTGKTRLALQVAANLLDEFKDGVFFVDLSTIRSPSLVLPAVERALTSPSAQSQSGPQSLLDQLREKEILLILDNFEQVIPAANDVAALLTSAPGLKILVTSRSLLRIYGEVDYEVPSLDVPDLAQVRSPQQLVDYESLQLFGENARAVKSGFTINSENAAVIAEICYRLDGLPLAIELAAARIRLLTPQQILKQLDDRLRFLSGGARNLPPRQQTLQGTIDWSYELLDAQEQALFRRLGAFAGGCTYEAAAAICSSGGDIDMFNSFEMLVNHSLLGQRDAQETSRFVMLQTIHDYAFAKLESSGELPEMRECHLTFFTNAAENAQRYLEQADQSHWLDRLERDHDNLSEALRTAAATRSVDRGVRLAQALRIYWFSRGYLPEGRGLVEDLLQLPMELKQRAVLLDCAAFLARYHGDYTAAETYINEGLVIARRLSDDNALANSLANAGFVFLSQNKLQRSHEVYAEALAIYEDYSNEQGMADAMAHLGLIALQENDITGARELFNSSLAIWERLGDRQGIAYAHDLLGDAAVHEGSLASAVKHYRESLRGAHAVGFHLVMATSLEGLAVVAAKRGTPKLALELAGAASEFRMYANAPASTAKVRYIEAALAPARECLGAEADEAFNNGRMLSNVEAIDLALTVP
jgi:predicted ATPase/class 3 adenylate cyclase